MPSMYQSITNFDQNGQNRNFYRQQKTYHLNKFDRTVKNIMITRKISTTSSMPIILILIFETIIS